MKINVKSILRSRVHKSHRNLKMPNGSELYSRFSGSPVLRLVFGFYIISSFWLRAETAALPATNWPNTAHTFLIFHFLSNGFQINAFWGKDKRTHADRTHLPAVVTAARTSTPSALRKTWLHDIYLILEKFLYFFFICNNKK